MAKIKKLQMWNTICTDAHVSVSKSLFGLRTTATYKPTNSVIEARTIELSREDGERLKNILTGSHKNLAEAIGNFHPEQVSYGNFMAEVCASRDSAFVAVLLLQFPQLSYEAVTDVLIFEGEDAQAVKQMF